MRRRTFDALASIGGLVLAVVLAVGGGLLVWGHSFVSNEVHSQLAAQKIYFPPKGDASLKALPAADRTAMSQYAGQQMLNGAQAQVYADHFIAVHLGEIGGGKTYAQLSAAALASPKNTALAEQVQTVFRGTTLRGMLLNAYGFWKMGQIMLVGYIIAFVGAGLFLLLALFGFWHLSRTELTTEMFTKREAGAHPVAAH
jgi:putative Ca2+/H+ antiporter (TMEM165/GDT1 family)